VGLGSHRPTIPETDRPAKSIRRHRLGNDGLAEACTSGPRRLESLWFWDERHVQLNSVIIPTYNERENIVALIGEILALPVPFEVFVVDDNSPDGTGQLADAMAARNPHVHVLHRPGKLGLGTAHIAGMRAAIEAGCFRVCTMDADFSHHPRHLPELVESLDKWDIVIGSRYVAGGGTLHCTASRKALSRGANLFARLVLGLPATDTTAGFRGYRRPVLESAPLDTIRSNGYSFLIEMLFLCAQKGYTVGEIPILFENRQMGSSKISRTEILRALQTVARLGWSRWGE